MADNQGAAYLEFSRREFFRISTRNNDTSGRYSTLVFHRILATHVYDLGALSEHYICAKHGLFFNAYAFDNYASGAKKTAIFNNYRSRLDGL